MNQYQEELSLNNFIRVDGLIARIYNDDRYTFGIPKPSDYPGKDYIAGPDFIFVFESKSDQTWYKKIDLTQEGNFRSNLFYIGYELKLDDDNTDRYCVNIFNTAFSLSFVIDLESFRIRALRYDYETENVDIFHSCESVFMVISGDISKKVEEFSKFIFSKDDADLKPIYENTAFLKKFSAELNKEKPVFMTQFKHMYLLVILLSYREGKFPYNLTFSEFHRLVSLPKPPMRFKKAD